jgi:hypothetical protein
MFGCRPGEAGPELEWAGVRPAAARGVARTLPVALIVAPLAARPLLAAPLVALTPPAAPTRAARPLVGAFPVESARVSLLPATTPYRTTSVGLVEAPT